MLNGWNVPLFILKVFILIGLQQKDKKIKKSK